MRGQGGPFTEWDYLNARRISDVNSYVPIEKAQVLSEQLSPEQEVIRRDNYQKLSSEARHVIKMILEAPAEMLQVMSTPITGRITKRSIEKFIAGYFWKRKCPDRRSKKIMRELSAFVRDFLV